MYPLVLRSAGAGYAAIAPAVALVFRNTGLSVGTAVAAVVIAEAGRVGGFPAEVGYTRALLVGAGGALVASLVALTLPRRLPPPSA
jgi:hypothetical protein